jgi:hypothetical protein
LANKEEQMLGLNDRRGQGTLALLGKKKNVVKKI